MFFGLSPRVWGSRREEGAIHILYRSIPTCVGQPREQRGRLQPTEVYPHVCGAAVRRVYIGHCIRGLSPRVWGSLSPVR